MAKKPIAPDVVQFEGVGRCFYKVTEYRAPLKGEFYLSGAIVAAYRSPSDLSSSYWVVVPTHHVAPGRVKGRPV